MDGAGGGPPSANGATYTSPGQTGAPNERLCSLGWNPGPPTSAFARRGGTAWVHVQNRYRGLKARHIPTQGIALGHGSCALSKWRLKPEVFGNLAAEQLLHSFPQASNCVQSTAWSTSHEAPGQTLAVRAGSVHRIWSSVMSFPIKTCILCEEEFELRPDKPGYANRR